MEVKWIKIVTDVFSDEKIMLMETLPEGDAIISIWFKLLCLAGKSNHNGFLMMSDRIPYTDEMLATIFRKPLNIVQIAMRCFVQFEMIEIIKDSYRIANWEKHQNVEGLDKIREDTRKRVAKHRAKQLEEPCNVTCNATVTESNATEVELEVELERDKDKNNTPCTPIKETIPYEQFKIEWNNRCKDLPKILSITKQRKEHIKTRWKEYKEIEPFINAFDKIQASSFCKGESSNNWKASFDWLMKNDTNMAKVLEGNYDDIKSKEPLTKSEQFKKSATEGKMRSFIEKHMND